MDGLNDWVGEDGLPDDWTDEPPQLGDALAQAAGSDAGLPAPFQPPVASAPQPPTFDPFQRAMDPNPIPAHLRVTPQITPETTPVAPAPAVAPPVSVAPTIPAQPLPVLGDDLTTPEVDVIGTALGANDPLTPEELADQSFDENGQRKPFDAFAHAMSPYPAGFEPVTPQFGPQPPADESAARLTPEIMANMPGFVQPRPRRPLDEILADQRANKTAWREQMVKMRPEVLAYLKSRSPASDDNDLQIQAERWTAEPTEMPPEIANDFLVRQSDLSPTQRGVAKGLYGLWQSAQGGAQALSDALGTEHVSARMREEGAKTAGDVAKLGTSKGLAGDYEGAVSSIIQQSPALAGGIFAKSPQIAASLGLLGAQTFGREYQVGDQAGLPQAENVLRSSIFTAFEVVGEMLGLPHYVAALRGALRGVPTKELASRMAQGLVRDVPGEMITHTGEFIADKAPAIGLRPDATLAEYLEGAGHVLSQTLMQGGGMGAAVAGAKVGSEVVRGSKSAAETLSGELERAIKGEFNLSAEEAATDIFAGGPTVSRGTQEPTHAKTKEIAPARAAGDDQQGVDETSLAAALAQAAGAPVPETQEGDLTEPTLSRRDPVVDAVDRSPREPDMVEPKGGLDVLGVKYEGKSPEKDAELVAELRKIAKHTDDGKLGVANDMAESLADDAMYEEVIRAHAGGKSFGPKEEVPHRFEGRPSNVSKADDLDVLGVREHKENLAKYGFKVVGDRISGAPAAIDTTQKLHGLVTRMANQAAGKSAVSEDADWYEDAGTMLRDLAHGDEAFLEKMVRITAKLSQSDSVAGNTTQMVKVAYQLARGEAPRAGRFPNKFAAEIKPLLEAETFDDKVSGVNQKLMNFYRNLRDPAFGRDDFPDAVTIDRHMYRRIFDEELKTTGGDAQYEFGKRVIQLATDKYNATHGAKLKPRQMQALLWGVQINEDAGVMTGPADNYPPKIAERTFNVTAETVPTTKTKAGEKLARATPEAKLAFTRESFNAVRSGGRDEIARRLGIALHTSKVSTGAYEGNIQPNVVTGIVAEGGKGEWSPALASQYAAAWQYVYRQDAVPWFRADPNLKPKDKGPVALGVGLTFHDELTAEHEQEFYDALQQAAPGVGYTKTAPNRVVLINYRGEDGLPFTMPDAEFGNKISGFFDAQGEALGIKDYAKFGAQTEYIYHDWEADPEGEAIEQRLGQAGGSDFLGWLRGRRDQADATAKKHAGEDLEVLGVEDRASAPPFYSALERALENVGTLSAPIAQWRGMIKNLKGVSPAEVAGTELNEWFDALEGARKLMQEAGLKDLDFTPGTEDAPARSGKITKAQILEFVKKNGVKVTTEVIAAQSDEEAGHERDARTAGTARRLREFVDYGLTTPGGSNDRVIMMKMPHATSLKPWRMGDTSKGIKASGKAVGVHPFTHMHWPGEENVLAHMRVNDRVDSRGRKILFVEEVQSDWAQKGRKQGFAMPGAPFEKERLRQLRDLTRSDLEAAQSLVRKYRGDVTAHTEKAEKVRQEYDRRKDPSRMDETREQLEEIGSLKAQASAKIKAAQLEVDRLEAEFNDLEARIKKVGGAVPAAPFVQSTEAWLPLAMKRLLRYAAEEGYDSVAFTSGQQQAERYDLTQVVDGIEYQKNDDGTFDVSATKDGHSVWDASGKTPKELEESLGKELVEKIVAGEGVPPAADAGRESRRETKQRVFDAMDRWLADARAGRLVDERMAPAAIDATYQRMRDAPWEYAGVLSHYDVTADDLEAIERYSDDAGANMTRLAGNDLKVGGHGMIGFYDKILPGVLNKLSAKLGGGKVGAASVPTKDALYGGQEFTYILSTEVAGFGNSLKESRYSVADKKTDKIVAGPFKTHEEARAWLQANEPGFQTDQPSIDITPEMRESLMQGQPLFVRGELPKGRSTVFTVDEIASHKSDEILPEVEARNHFVAPRNKRFESAGFSLQPQQVQVMSDVIHDLYEAGMPKVFLDAVDNFFVFGGPKAGQHEGVYITTRGWVGIKEANVEWVARHPGDLGHQQQLRGHVMHEITHAVDNLTRGDGETKPTLEDFISTSSPRLGFFANNGKVTVMGDLIAEAFEAYHNGAEGEAAQLSEYLDYPLAAVGDASDALIKLEVFAQMVRLHITNPALMERMLPKWSAAMKEIFNAAVPFHSLADARSAISRTLRSRSPNVGAGKVVGQHGKGGPDAGAGGVLGVREPGKKLEQERQRVRGTDVVQIDGEPPGKYAGNINLDRIKAPGDIKALIADTAAANAPAIERARRGTISHDETVKLAAALGMTEAQLLDRETGVAFNSEESYAARSILIHSAIQTRKAAEKAAGGSEADIAEWMAAVHKHAAIEAQVAGIAAEAGRALNQFRILAEALAQSGVKQGAATKALAAIGDAGVPAGNALVPAKPVKGEKLTPEALEKKRIEAQAAEAGTAIAKPGESVPEVIERAGGIDSLRAVAKTMAEASDMESINEAARKAAQTTRGNPWLEAWKAMMLSGPRTHTTNMLSNSLVIGLRVPERQVAGILGMLHGGTSPAEAAGEVLGFVLGVPKALMMAARAFKEGQMVGTAQEAVHKPAISAENLGYTGKVGDFVDFAGNVIRLPFRFLSTEDQFFRVVNEEMERYAIAARQGSLAAMKKALTHPTAAQAKQIEDAGLYYTFNKKLGPAGQKLQLLLNSPGGGRWWQLVMPFVRTPLNIVKFAGERTAFGLASKNVRAEIMAGGQRADRALAKMIVGSSIAYWAYAMAASLQLTGGGDPDKNKKRLRREAGIPDYSIKINGTWYSYRRLEPFGMILGIAADMYEMNQYLKQEQKEHFASMLGMAVAQNLTSKTFLKGIADFLNATGDPERYGASYAGQFVGSIVPSFLAQYAGVEDDVAREAYSLMEQVKRRTPMRGGLEPKLDTWGQEVPSQGYLGPDYLSPVASDKESDDIVKKEVVRLGVSISRPGKEVMGVKLTPEQITQYRKLAGGLAYQGVYILVSSPGYPGLPEWAKKDSIEMIVSEARSAAGTAMAASMPGKVVDEKLKGFK